jgi:uncharacterized protein (TIGR04255 family)
MENYPRAPIVEAILDIQVKWSSPPAQDTFAQLAKSLEHEYPTSQSVGEVQVSLVNAPAFDSSSVTQSVHVSGFRLTTSQNDRILQILPRGVTFSHLPPYTSWETFRSEARLIWDGYVEYAKPVAVTRVALRYINRIEIPMERFELSDYFNLYPEVPKTITQDMSGFFMQVQMPQNDLASDITAVINFAIAGRRDDGATGMLLDIDVFAVRDLPTSAGEVFELCNLLRVRKNEIFEASISEKARELFRK